MSSTFSFPSPVGGVGLAGDLVPSILLAILYALLLPIFFVRLANNQTRAVLGISAVLTCIERVVIFCLRAKQSRTPGLQTSGTLATYMQATIALAYIAVAQDTVSLLRCLYVNSTKGPIPNDVDNLDSPVGTTSSSQIPLSPSRGNRSFSENDGELLSDQPRRRAFYRRLTDVLRLLFLVATVLGIVGNTHYKGGMSSAGTANEVMVTRYMSSGISLILIILLAVLVVRARRLPRVRPIHVILLLAILTCNVSSAIFRLSFMYNRTTSLTSTAPGSGNTVSEKVTFYIFHMLSDWLACFIFLVPNIREIFNTGMWGDWRSTDPPPESSELSKKKKGSYFRRADPIVV
ncbi:hypothetical protein F5J12DRAFT_195757 [Pisolithus orientalis]|uniref:uncharacterized protein n=1 Tax=Pisolithus orientalis TaxID=936130 RepID=UPI002225108A|nr:uncharacterized protein F5J12DRAFT_195757 [Pisolithus orientalis]KAI6033039.1 hypothetical protein F5J12DRAFT_195757 [Pisolithus orientalis]